MLGRSRPYAVAIAAMVVIALFPARHRGTSVQSGSANGTVTAGAPSDASASAPNEETPTAARATSSASAAPAAAAPRAATPVTAARTLTTLASKQPARTAGVVGA